MLPAGFEPRKLWFFVFNVESRGSESNTKWPPLRTTVFPHSKPLYFQQFGKHSEQKKTCFWKSCILPSVWGAACACFSLCNRAQSSWRPSAEPPEVDRTAVTAVKKKGRTVPATDRPMRLFDPVRRILMPLTWVTESLHHQLLYQDGGWHITM